MRVLFVIGSLEVGGAEQHLLRVSEGLRGAGLEPEVFALRPEGPIAEALVRAGIPVHGVHLPLWWRRLGGRERTWMFLPIAVASLWWVYWRRRAHVVHFFLSSAYVVGGVAALLGPRMLRIASRRCLNDYLMHHKYPAWARIEYFLHRRMDYVCGNARAVVAQLRGEGVPAQRLRLIYNGIDTQQFRPQRSRQEVRRELGIPDAALVFTVVANLIAYKGHADLIAALTAIGGRLPAGWTCLCVGRDDGIGEALQRQAAEAGLGAQVRLLGARRDVADLLGSADIGVLCSHHEGFSNAVIEAMACGLPMVVTDVGGNAEAVVHGETGVVVPARDPEALAGALLQLASEPGWRRSLGEAGQRRVEEHFSMTACVDRYLQLYRGALEPAPCQP